MNRHLSLPIDDTADLVREGYAFLPNRRQAAGSDVVDVRLLGRRVVAACGPSWARLFYDSDLFERHKAVPEPVRSTLFGKGAVHTLDGEPHRRRKQMFTSVLGPPGIGGLVDAVTAEWDDAARAWSSRDRVVLFDESAELLWRAVWRWTGLSPWSVPDARRCAQDMVTMVDGFASLGSRHWRARGARRRQERLVTKVVQRVREARQTDDVADALHAVAWHRDSSGELLPPDLAAVELLNIVRPTVAISWFVAFAAHALQVWPDQRAPLLSGDPARVTAFVHEVRRFYPFAPFVGAIARRDQEWAGHQVRAGGTVLLDLFGQNHHPDLWADPYRFDPDRFVGREIGAYELVPQGGGDPETGHRCPGEPATVAALEALLPRLAGLGYAVPEQDLHISLARIPARPEDKMVISEVRPGS